MRLLQILLYSWHSRIEFSWYYIYVHIESDLKCIGNVSSANIVWISYESALVFSYSAFFVQTLTFCPVLLSGSRPILPLSLPMTVENMIAAPCISIFSSVIIYVILHLILKQPPGLTNWLLITATCYITWQWTTSSLIAVRLATYFVHDWGLFR